MTKEEIARLQGEGIELKHKLDDMISPEAYEVVNRIIEIELLLEAESNK